jgi:uncharacterized glyoxalase superfamily protein PhnB
MAVKKITAVLLADRIEPCVKFWVEQLGFEKTVEVPEGDHLAFASLQKGPVELMYQTYSSVESDDHSHKGFTKGPTFLFVEVENLDETIRAVNGAEVVMPVRTTFYGSKEIGVKDPAGHIVTFAQFGAAA